MLDFFAALRLSVLRSFTMERQSLIFLSVLVIFSLACGLLDDEDTNVSYTEELPQSFTIDANQLCPEGEDCSGNSVPAPADQQLATIEFAGDIDVVEETGRTELRDYAGKFRSIEIVRVDYAVAGNDLTFDLPETKLFLAPMGVDSKDHEDAVELATIPTVAAGTNKNGKAVVAEAGRSASSDLLQNLQLSTIVFAQPVVKEGQDMPPSGSAEMKVTVHVKFTANPQDAI
jgi:hypothetical protein